jgi:hypothetical protein
MKSVKEIFSDKAFYLKVIVLVDPTTRLSTKYSKTLLPDIVHSCCSILGRCNNKICRCGRFGEGALLLRHYACRYRRLRNHNGNPCNYLHYRRYRLPLRNVVCDHWMLPQFNRRDNRPGFGDHVRRKLRHHTSCSSYDSQRSHHAHRLYTRSEKIMVVIIDS